VTDFSFPGELFGYSGIYQGYYSVNAEALRETLVCVIPFEELKKACPEIPALQSPLRQIDVYVTSLRDAIGPV